MWRIIMLTTLLYIFNDTESRPMMESMEMHHFWPLTSISNDFSTFQHQRTNNKEKLFDKQRNSNRFNQIFSTSSDDDSDDDIYLPKIDKRALAMIARWGPFSNIGKQRSPIRSNFIDPENNINTQTRGRMVGQPLRWG